MNSIINRKFNKLKVIDKSNLKSASGCIKYKCECECGNITYATKNDLKSGHKKSCGCYRESKISKGIIGKTFGYLKVLEHINTDKEGRTYYKCKCKCGVIVDVRSDCLKGKNNQSCGCKQKENARLQSKKIRVENTNIAFIKGALKNNKSKRAKSGIKGVYFDERRKYWYAQITFQKKNYYLGSYGNNKEEAINARKAAEEKLFGNFIKWYKEKYEK
ncbi:AP2 domain-containing protein [Clostridium botulinum]|uniref:AP2 domain-containing protein n=1 Tax=Clostridium botulinum TaxID=1491 RepID=UPI00099D71A4|nr:AP2 domain-containing protein [Clostridium botulinum]MCC5439800.1 hypothetical protein [Clostridium botulinum]NFR57601.1 hypothetical protein [Clostridium botulinum]